MYLLLHKEIWLHIIHYLQKLHISNQGCKKIYSGVVLNVETMLEIQLRKIHINDHTWLDMGDVMNLFPL